MKYIKLMRIPHWIKNILVLLPVFFGGKILYGNKLLQAVMACIGFCFASSVVYCVNDIKDVESDRLHEKKCMRPIASGEVTIKSAWICSTCLLVLSIIINWYVMGQEISGWLVWSAYLLINVLYSLFRLKDKAVVDVVLLVSGFFLRVLYGSVATNIFISGWLYLVVVSASFYMAFGKRKGELMKSGEKTRAVLGNYNKEFLNNNMTLCVSLCITFYALWCLEKGKYMFRMSNLLMTVPLLMILFFRYGLDVENGSDGDPVEVVLKDKVLLILAGIFGVALVVLLYGGVK